MNDKDFERQLAAPSIYPEDLIYPLQELYTVSAMNDSPWREVNNSPRSTFLVNSALGLCLKLFRQGSLSEFRFVREVSNLKLKELEGIFLKPIRYGYLVYRHEILLGIEFLYLKNRLYVADLTPLSLEEVLCQLVSKLQRLHNLGLTHGDISKDNFGILRGPKSVEAFFLDAESIGKSTQWQVESDWRNLGSVISTILTSYFYANRHKLDPTLDFQQIL